MDEKLKSSLEEFLSKAIPYFDESARDLKKSFWSKPSSWISALSVIIALCGLAFGFIQTKEAERFEKQKEALQIQVDTLRAQKVVIDNDIVDKKQELEILESSSISHTIEIQNLKKKNSELDSIINPLIEQNEELRHSYHYKLNALKELEYEFDSIKLEKKLFIEETNNLKHETEFLRIEKNKLTTELIKHKPSETETSDFYLTLISPKLKVFDRPGYHPTSPNEIQMFLEYPSAYKKVLIDNIESVHYKIEGINFRNAPNGILQAEEKIKNDMYWYADYIGKSIPKRPVVVIKFKNNEQIYEKPFYE